MYDMVTYFSWLNDLDWDLLLQLSSRAVRIEAVVTLGINEKWYMTTTSSMSCTTGVRM